MNFEWDKTKRLANLEKHKVDFSDVTAFSFADALERIRVTDDETRIEATGPIGDRLHVLVYTWRNGVRRIISLRKANRREVNSYVEAQDRETDT